MAEEWVSEAQRAHREDTTGFLALVTDAVDILERLSLPFASEMSLEGALLASRRKCPKRIDELEVHCVMRRQMSDKKSHSKRKALSTGNASAFSKLFDDLITTVY